MARRRLNTILATTTLAAGLSVAPAWGQSLGDLTDIVEETVTETTEVVEDTTGTVTDTVEDTASTLEDTLTGGGEGTEDATEDSTEDSSEGAPLDVDLKVDIAPEDEDGSPQLEVDGGVTVGDQTVDVGSITDPIEEVVDPDPSPSDPSPSDPAPSDPSPSPDANQPDAPDDHQTDTSSTSRDGGDDSTPASRLGGLLEGGGVTAAGDEPRPADVPGSSEDDPGRAGRTVGESFAAFAANNRGSNVSRSGSSTTGSGSADSSEIAPPQVADPADPSFEQFPASQVEEPSVVATRAAADGPAGSTGAVLKALAALMVVGTGVAFKRTLDEA